jgi:hypothetical protein
MLDTATLTANMPAADLGRAHAFCADTLGLSPTQELDGIMLVYRLAVRVLRPAQRALGQRRRLARRHQPRSLLRTVRATC